MVNAQYLKRIYFQGLFVPFMVESALELVLRANQNLTDAMRLQWKPKSIQRMAVSSVVKNSM